MNHPIALIILVGFLAVIAGFILLVVFLRWRWRRKLEARARVGWASYSPEELRRAIKKPQFNPGPDTPRSFGYKCNWLAIRTDDPAKVVEALQLTDARPSSWESGIEAGYIGRVFVSPPVDGWILAVSSSLPSEPDTVAPFIEVLSRHFDEVQYFGTHRVVEYHAWALARAGRIVRAYAYVGERGETLWDVGARTAGEIELGVKFFNERSPEAKDEKYFERTDLTYPGEEYVMQIAGKWSINPQELEEMGLPESSGFVGRLPR